MKVPVVVALVVAAIAAVAPVPSRANVDFSPSQIGSLASLLPDTCFPSPGGSYCIQFTNGAFQTGLSSLGVQNQLGVMASKQLTQADFGELATHLGDTLGVTMAVQQQQLGQSSPTAPADAEADLLANDLSEQQRMQALLDELAASDSDLQANQLQGVATQNNVMAVMQQTQLQAAAILQQKAAGAHQGRLTGGALDVSSGDPSSGWSLF